MLSGVLTYFARTLLLLPISSRSIERSQIPAPERIVTRPSQTGSNAFEFSPHSSRSSKARLALGSTCPNKEVGKSRR